MMLASGVFTNQPHNSLTGYWQYGDIRVPQGKGNVHLALGPTEGPIRPLPISQCDSISERSTKQARQSSSTTAVPTPRVPLAPCASESIFLARLLRAVGS